MKLDRSLTNGTIVIAHLLGTLRWRNVSLGSLQFNTPRAPMVTVTSPRLLNTNPYRTTSKQQEIADLVNDVSKF